LQIKLVTHSSHNFGYGHLSRARTLQEQFTILQHEVELVEISSTFDFNNFFLKLRDESSLIVLDFDPRFWQSVVMASQTLLLNRLVTTRHIFFVYDTPDFLVRNLLRLTGENVYFLNPYQNRIHVEEKHIISNLKFFPISNVLCNVRKGDLDFTKFSQVTISCGGSDPHKITLIFLQLLEAFEAKALDIAVIIGPIFEDGYVEILRETAASIPHTIRFIASENYFYEVFLNSTLVLTTGGLTRYELAFCGIPFITINFDPIQNITSEMFSAIGASVHIGNSGQNLAELKMRFLSITGNLLNDNSALGRMSKMGRSLFDEIEVPAASAMIDLLGESGKFDF
jgi:spore coat polysaccharide biosynthesis predicted glycosyltransferase SpsG